MKANIILDTHAEKDEDLSPTARKLLDAAAKIHAIADAPPDGWFDKQDPDLREGLASRYSPEALPVKSVARFIEFASPTVLLLVADWLEAEAKTLALFPVFAQVMEAALQNDDGSVSGTLKIGVTPEGNLDARVESTPSALRLAEEILSW